MELGCAMTGQCDDIKRLKVECEEMRKDIIKLEGITGGHSTDIGELKTNHAETRVYVKQILDSIDKLEDKIFTYVGQITASKEKDGDADRKDRNADTERWIELIKWILGGTVAVIVGYIFGGGNLPT